MHGWVITDGYRCKWRNNPAYCRIYSAGNCNNCGAYRSESTVEVETESLDYGYGCYDCEVFEQHWVGANACKSQCPTANDLFDGKGRRRCIFRNTGKCVVNEFYPSLRHCRKCSHNPHYQPEQEDQRPLVPPQKDVAEHERLASKCQNTQESAAVETPPDADKLVEVRLPGGSVAEVHLRQASLHEAEETETMKEQKISDKARNALDSTLEFLRTAATEGAKDGASDTAVTKARDIVKRKLGAYYPKFLQESPVGKVVDDVLIPTGLHLAAELFPTLPYADTIRSVAGRSARVAFQRKTQEALKHLTPMFDEIGRAIAEDV